MNITQEDLMLILQQSAAPQAVRIKVEVLSSNKQLVGYLIGVVSGNSSINSQSDVRRTGNITIQPTIIDNIKLAADNLLWIDKEIRLWVGLYNPRTHDYKYYPFGCFVYTDTSRLYDAQNNTININFADHIKKLDGTQNGQLGAEKILFPAYEKNEETGEVLKRYVLRDAIISVLKDLCNITDFKIDDIGEFYALEQNNENWKEYRESHPDWDKIPFDQEFQRGCSVLSILKTFRDLYPNYEMFFEPDNNSFTMQMIPSCYEDSIYLDDHFIQRVLISENTSVDLTKIKNICMVWGQTIETDFYTENCSYASNVYNCNIQAYDKYYSGDVFSVKIPTANLAGPYVNINGLGSIKILNESDNSPIKENTLAKNEVYSFRVKTQYKDGETKIDCYLLGQWKVQALNVLTNGKKSNVKIIDEDTKEEIELYSKRYFQKKYNCDNVTFTIIANSPYTVEKIGELLDVKTGQEYDKITSTSLATDRAKYENWKNSRLTDSISITTLLLPFLDVNKKISYKPHSSSKELPYIIKSISHNFDSFTSSIELYRFYPLYESLLKNAGTHKVLSEYMHGTLGKYTHEQLTTVISEEEIYVSH